MQEQLYQQLLRANNLSLHQEPLQQDSILSLRLLVSEILAPVHKQFGQLVLTYGFCGNQLRLALQKNKLNHISPKHDQHASHELNQSGQRVCERDGAACDFLVPTLESSNVAQWLISNLPFDRLYYYGKSKPIHVSYGPEHSRQVIFMHEKDGKRYPKRYKRYEPKHFEYN